MSERILNIGYMLTETFKNMPDCDSVRVAIGRYELDKDKRNNIIIMFINDGDSGDDTVQIKTDMPEVSEILLLVVSSIMSSLIDFEDLQVTKMCGGTIDMDNIPPSILLTMNKI